jgi:hypothetical protein
MIALYGDEGTHIRQVLGNHYPEVFEKVESMAQRNTYSGMEPDPLGTFNILANSGHSLPSAIADLIDNSIDNRATKIEIAFPNPNDGGKWMCIRDNGTGLSRDELRNAMRIGNQRDYEARELGRYGYGLKGASWSQADTLTVLTKKNGVSSVLTWDKGHLERTRKWEVLEAPIPSQYQQATEVSEDTGTSVLLRNMRPPAKTTTIRGIDPHTIQESEIRDHLGLVFHRFLTGDARGHSKVTIYINGVPVEPNNPVSHPSTTKLNSQTIQFPTDNETGQVNITLQAFILPTEEELKTFHAKDGEKAVSDALSMYSLRNRMNENQGLFFYRLDRLIKWGGWCGIFAEDEHTKLLRVTVDFDRAADEPMKVNISKREVQLPLNLREAIKSAVKEARTEARNRYDKKKRKPKQDQIDGEGQDPQPSPVIPSVPTTIPAGGTSKPAPVTPERIEIRVVEMDDKWKLSKGFFGETKLQINEEYLELVTLAKAIGNNDEAKKALTSFLASLEREDDA